MFTKTKKKWIKNKFHTKTQETECNKVDGIKMSKSQYCGKAVVFWTWNLSPI